MNLDAIFGWLMIYLLVAVVVVFVVRAAIKKFRSRKTLNTVIEAAEGQVSGSVRRTPERAATNDESSSGIFLCYRRRDSSDATGRIYDRLVARFGKDAVFKDVDSIPLGVDFRKAIGETIGRCRVFLAIIGDSWLDASKLGSRLHDRRDHVRMEIEAALRRGIPVVPVLVRGAAMPTENALPDELKDLAFRNGISVRADPDFHQDIARLIASVHGHLTQEDESSGGAIT